MLRTPQDSLACAGQLVFMDRLEQRMEPGMKWFRLKHTLRAGMRPIPLLFVLLGIGLCHMKR